MPHLQVTPPNNDMFGGEHDGSFQRPGESPTNNGQIDLSAVEKYLESPEPSKRTPNAKDDGPDELVPTDVKFGK